MQPAKQVRFQTAVVGCCKQGHSASEASSPVDCTGEATLPSQRGSHHRSRCHWMQAVASITPWIGVLLSGKELSNQLTSLGQEVLNVA